MDTTQNDILLHLQKYGSITPFDAWYEYGCYRLSVVISRLRKHHIITTEPTDGVTKHGKKRQYATYCYWGKKENAESNSN